MNLHQADLMRRLNEYLARRQPPKSFGSDDKLKIDQVAAYVAILRNLAPEGDGLHDWWSAFIEDLGSRNETWAWPTESDVRKSAREVSKKIHTGGNDWQVDPLAVAVKRIEQNEPIGDNWLWGQNALLLIAKVGMDKIQERRDRHVSHLASLYDIEPAKRMLNELQYRHSEAIRASEERRHATPREMPRKFGIKSVADLLAEGPQYVPLLGAAE